MEKQQVIISLTILLNRGIGSNQIQIFDDRKHDDLVKELRDYLDANKQYLGGNIHLEITQALNDHGVDLLLTIEGICKIGFQIKSPHDVSEQDFQSKVKRWNTVQRFTGIKQLTNYSLNLFMWRNRANKKAYNLLVRILTLWTDQLHCMFRK
ncbi:hypothetical protein [Brevibacillus agri]|uniref:hypothetical protein n=1 Tax=Brevibacillus agri TaxID=51101 RepID=UPI003D19D610